MPELVGAGDPEVARIRGQEADLSRPQHSDPHPAEVAIRLRVRVLPLDAMLRERHSSSVQLSPQECLFAAGDDERDRREHGDGPRDTEQHVMAVRARQVRLHLGDVECHDFSTASGVSWTHSAQSARSAAAEARYSWNLLIQVQTAAADFAVAAVTVTDISVTSLVALTPTRVTHGGSILPGERPAAQARDQKSGMINSHEPRRHPPEPQPLEPERFYSDKAYHDFWWRVGSTVTAGAITGGLAACLAPLVSPAPDSVAILGLCALVACAVLLYGLAKFVRAVPATRRLSATTPSTSSAS